MTPQERKIVAVVTKYVSETFTESDWIMLGQMTGKLGTIKDHPRLFRSYNFGDDDYQLCVAEVLESIFSHDSAAIADVVGHYDIDLWYQQKEPEKWKRVFLEMTSPAADFWKDGYLKLFISHLSAGKGRVSALRSNLTTWGISAFVAKEDIQPSREWRLEVEAALETMEVMVPVVEEGFKESDWCAQEVGYALGRKVDIIPIKSGMDPFGFFGKIQGIEGKGKFPSAVAAEIVELLLKKPKYRSQLLVSMAKAFATLDSKPKISKIETLDSWSIATDEQIKVILETSALSDFERKALKNLIGKVGAFKAPASPPSFFDDDVPF